MQTFEKRRVFYYQDEAAGMTAEGAAMVRTDGVLGGPVVGAAAMYSMNSQSFKQPARILIIIFMTCCKTNKNIMRASCQIASGTETLCTCNNP